MNEKLALRQFLDEVRKMPEAEGVEFTTSRGGKHTQIRARLGNTERLITLFNSSKGKDGVIRRIKLGDARRGLVQLRQEASR